MMINHTLIFRKLGAMSTLALKCLGNRHHLKTIFFLDILISSLLALVVIKSWYYKNLNLEIIVQLRESKNLSDFIRMLGEMMGIG